MFHSTKIVQVLPGAPASGTVGAKVETSATTALPTVPALAASASAFSAATASAAQEALSEASPGDHRNHRMEIRSITYMSHGQYSWLITIKNGASHPMVHSIYLIY